MSRAWLTAVLGVAALAAGCTPVRTTIRPPYVVDGRTLNTSAELETYAAERCTASNPGSPLPPQHFTTDGCSAFPDDGWRTCCLTHDIAYWCGATVRLEADRAFRACLREHSSAAQATMMFLGVRIGGGRFSPFPWRFGYGYPWPHRKPAASSEPRPETAPTSP